MSCEDPRVLVAVPARDLPDPPTVMPAHRMTILDRGAEHRHRFDACCLCGWSGVHRRRKRDAVDLYREHRQSSDRKRRLVIPGPRPLTAVDKLPPELRLARP